MRFENQTFVEQKIQLDWNEFVNCKFIRCNVVYAGAGSTHLAGTEIEECFLHFSDAADRTIKFLKQNYLTGGTAGKTMVEMVIDFITSPEDGKDGAED